MSETTKPRTWEDEKMALDVWKYYGSIGGADKDQMIKIVTWLLTLSTGIVSLYATDQLKESRAIPLVFLAGVLVSSLAAFVALLYGGYAAWNWAIADRIAESYSWKEQSPKFRPIPEASALWRDKIPLHFAVPCEDRVAPVFWVFFLFSVASLTAHCALFVACVA